MSEPNKDHKGITSVAIKHPVGTSALTALVIVMGLFFLDRLALDLLPSITYPQITVTTNYPGVAPEVMEQQATRVLESNLSATENIVAIESRASEGRTNVNLIFDYGTNIDLALQDAARNLELARTQLPSGIEPPRIYKRDPSQDAIYELGFTSSIRTPVEVRDWMDHYLAPQIQAIRGVGGVEVAGGQVREIQVVLDQHLLEYYGIAISDIEQLLSDENVDIAAGQVTSKSFDVMAKTDGRFKDISDIENLILKVKETNEHIRLNEVATIKDTHKEQRIFVRLNDQAANRLAITKLPDANTVAVIDRIKSEIQRLEQSGFIPEDISFATTQDQSFFINSSIRAVSTAAIVGAILAMLVVLLFLGSFRKALIIGVTIPLALFVAFVLMATSGLSLNIMSLGGLALGVGLLLDNGIVMLENIFRHHEQYQKDSQSAALDGSKEVTSAIIASTMTNLAAVVPFLLIPGLAAMVFSDLILTISMAILASLMAAVTIVPMLSALLSNIQYKSHFDKSALIEKFNQGLIFVRNYYVKVAKILFNKRLTVLTGAAIFFVVALWGFSQLGNEFLPQVDDGNVRVTLHLPPGSPPDITNEYALKVEKEINSMPYVENVFGLVGGHLGGGILNERPGTARYSIHLSPATQRPNMSAGKWVQEMQDKLDALEIPGARVSARPPSIPGIRLSTAGSGVSIGIVGDDIEVLTRLGHQLLVELQDIPGLTDLDMSRSDRSPLLNINVDRERAAEFGLNISEVGQLVRSAVNGTVPTRFSSGTTYYDIRLLFPRDQVRDSEDLGNITLFRKDEESLKLSDVASFQLTDGPAHIERENQVRVLRLGGEVNTAVSDVGTVNEQIRNRVSQLNLPEGYGLIFGGEEEVIRETTRALTTVILLAIFLVFVVLAVQYEKLSNPLVILSAAPLALVGVTALLWITGTNLSAPAFLGIVLLVGIVVNNAILLVEYIEIGKEQKGLNSFDAAINAAEIRFRPIMMTTTTTVFGMFPLALGMGEGAELMRPLAIAVIGGLMVSMILTLIVVPCLYLLINKPTSVRGDI